jgi:hypothetical protein
MRFNSEKTDLDKSILSDFLNGGSVIYYPGARKRSRGQYNKSGNWLIWKRIAIEVKKDQKKSIYQILELNYGGALPWIHRVNDRRFYYLERSRLPVKCPRLQDLSRTIERYTRSGEVAPWTP